MSNGRAEAISAYERPWAYVVLTKPDVTFLVVITTVAGFYLGSSGPMEWARLMNTLCGTLLVAGGTAALNQYVERHMDAVMRRTAARPLPHGNSAAEGSSAFRRSHNRTRHSVAGPRRKCSGGIYSARHQRLVSRRLHPAKDAHNACNRRRSHSWRTAAVDRMGGCQRHALCRRLDSLRDLVFLAVPALHGHRLDVSRGLRPCRHSACSPSWTARATAPSA